MKPDTVQPPPAARAFSLPSPELTRLVDRLLSPVPVAKINRLINTFKWGERPVVPEDIGQQVLRQLIGAVAHRRQVDGTLYADATGLPERYGRPEKRVHDRRTATLILLQDTLDQEDYYNNTPLAMDPKIALLLYPRICAQIMALSSGYASPVTAALIFTSAMRKGTPCCEWTSACYGPPRNLAVRSVRKKIGTETVRGEGGRYERDVHDWVEEPNPDLEWNNDMACLKAATGHFARKAGKSDGFYGSYTSKFILILRELLVEGGVPHSVDYV